jgi:hypothetical protein
MCHPQNTKQSHSSQLLHLFVISTIWIKCMRFENIYS